ncbi:uncharacterized protein JN550_003253 [Neoarthrinium moseri]|uniref:uncharacterized protein n=1 Tax=Neoarthrinium moseri TaxID=1658444 RepID=UPI001FDC00A3|nr:uncharacterized protein JN550_003253 [Neoarthrinium moseri]KAI1873984.1 hypothetical protein JN550_003253 [Neoarthrinium moseri]
MSSQATWVTGIEGNFLLHDAVLKLLPEGTEVISAFSSGVSAWSKTAKVSVVLPNGSLKRYFLKCVSGESAKALVEGEYQSAYDINQVMSDLVPKPIGWGKYRSGDTQVYFFLGDFHDMDFSSAPEPAQFTARIAELHRKGVSPNGMFGYPVPTVIGIMKRTVTWETSWAKSFTHQLNDAIGYDNQTNAPWPEYDAACKQLIDAVIPRLLGTLQSDRRHIIPVLIHGDLWERNVGTDRETGKTIVFDPGCTYAHNEMEFGTWRCSWAFHFNSLDYMKSYQHHIKPSEPADEFDDRNRLYSIYPYLIESAGHAGSASRQLAYNDLLFLCEKYAPLASLDKYNPKMDISVTGAHVPFVVKQLE